MVTCEQAWLNTFSEELDVSKIQHRGHNFVLVDGGEETKVKKLRLDRYGFVKQEIADVFTVQCDKDQAKMIFDTKKFQMFLGKNSQLNHTGYESMVLSSKEVTHQDKTQKVYHFETPKNVLNDFLEQKRVIQNFFILKHFLIKCFDFHHHPTMLLKRG